VDIDHAFLIIEGGRKTLLVHRMNAALARTTFHGKVMVYEDAMDALSARLRGRDVLYDADSMSAALAARLGRFCRLRDHSAALARMRLVKSPGEVSCVARAVKATKEIFESLDIKGAATELDVKKQILIRTLEMGLEPAFDPIVATDGNTSFPHYRGGKKRLGTILLVDCGVKYGHYCSDLTRCFISKGERKKRQEYERLQDICWFIADSLPQMGSGKEVSQLSKDLMRKAGFPEMIHSIGHGVGLEVHELPSLGPKSRDPLAGATMAIEPAFYLPKYGMRYEETVYNDGKKARVL
jgi:Xaa-Pro aminopeptidase